MITLLSLIITFLLLILVTIWWPFFRTLKVPAPSNKPTTNTLRDQTNLQLYQEHKQEIEQDFKQGAIDEENYQYLLAELDKSLLQDITANEKEAAKRANTAKLSPLWPIVISLFVIIFSLSLYKQQGSYLKLMQPKQSAQANEQAAMSNEQKMLAQVQKIKEALKETPENSNLWYSLGQANISLGNFKGAVKAFDQVIKLEGKKPELLGAKAQAVYYNNGQKITKEVQTLIDEALALDKLDPSTNVLLGMDNFIHQHYEKAIHYWQQLIDSGRENINAQALMEAVNEAKRRLANLNNSANNNTNNSNMENSPKLTLNVSLSEEFKQLLAKSTDNADKVIFVYAIPATGSRMPLAAMKLKASDLPISVTLTNAQAMNPQANLSSAEQVNIYAILSQHGSAGIKSGDFKAELKNIAVNNTTPLNLVINQRVP